MGTQAWTTLASELAISMSAPRSLSSCSVSSSVFSRWMYTCTLPEESNRTGSSVAPDFDGAAAAASASLVVRPPERERVNSPLSCCEAPCAAGDSRCSMNCWSSGLTTESCLPAPYGGSSANAGVPKSTRQAKATRAPSVAILISGLENGLRKCGTIIATNRVRCGPH